jgi:hypothetical protein
MQHEESEARRLAATLTAEGVVASVDAAGGSWHVDVAAISGRSLQVTCFWYERKYGARPLGMKSPYQGPEFMIDFLDAGGCTVSGRTTVRADVAGCVRAWLSGASLDDLVRHMPFVDQGPRALRAIGGLLDPRIRWEIVQSRVWAYADGRACVLDGVSCGFLVGPAQVASTSESTDVSGDVTAWLLDGVPLAVLAGRGVQVGRHAHVLESDPARCCWLHVRDRIANPDDVLAPLAPLIDLLASSSIASRFYPFSSLFFLCFSASSHFPFVCLDLTIAPAADGDVYVDDVRCTLGEAVARIESALSASVVEPFFGSRDDLDVRVITESLSRRGNALRPEIIQRGPGQQIWLRVLRRSCQLTADILRCFEADAEFTVICADPDDVVEQAWRFLREGATIEDLTAVMNTEPRVGRVGRSRKRLDTDMTRPIGRSREFRVWRPEPRRSRTR